MDSNTKCDLSSVGLCFKQNSFRLSQQGLAQCLTSSHHCQSLAHPSLGWCCDRYLSLCLISVTVTCSLLCFREPMIYETDTIMCSPQRKAELTAMAALSVSKMLQQEKFSGNCHVHNCVSSFTSYNIYPGSVCKNIPLSPWFGFYSR